MTSFCLQLKSDEILNKLYLWKRSTTNDTLNAVAMTTAMPLVLC